VKFKAVALRLFAGDFGATAFKQGFQIGDGVVVGCRYRQTYGRHFEYFAIDEELLDLPDIDRRHHPAASFAADKTFSFQAQQCRAYRRSGGAQLCFGPALGQPFAGADLQAEDHLAQLFFDIVHLRHGCCPWSAD